MDEQRVRAQLEEAKAELTKLDEKRDALVSFVHGHEAWLRVFSGGESTAPTQPSVSQPVALRRPRKTAIKPHGFNTTVLRVIREARGAPLHTREILRRVRDLGADSKGKDPIGLVDLVAYSLAKTQPIVKVAPRTWAWRIDPETDTPVPDPYSEVSGDSDVS